MKTSWTSIGKGTINIMNNSCMGAEPNGTIMMANRTLEEMIGFWRDERLGQPGD
jgi:hypothetical protein